MSEEWKKTETLVSFGRTWSLNGIGKTYVTGVTSHTQTITLRDTPTAKFWFPGNGVDSYLVSSATITQGGLSVPVKVNGKTSFYVPKDGRWSDWASIANFSLPGEVTFQFSIASTAAKIPTAPTAPTTPVGVSAYEYLEYETGESDPNGIVNELVTSLPPDVSTYLLNSDSLSGWSITESGTATATLSDGIHLQSGSVANNDAWVELTRVLEKPTGSFVIILEISCDSLGSWPSADYFVLNWWPIYHEKTMPYMHYGFSFWEDGIWKENEAPGLSIPGLINIGSTQTWRFEYDYGSSITTVYMNNHPCGRFSQHSFSGTGVGEPEENNIYLKLYGTAKANCGVHIKSIQIYTPVASTLTEVTSNWYLVLTTNPAAGDTLTISGGSSGNVVFTFVDHYPNNSTEIQIGADVNATAANIATAINNIPGAEFVATVIEDVIVYGTAQVSTPFSVTTTSTGISAGTITGIYPGFNDEEISVADSFTATEGGKSVQENASASDAVDGLIDGLSETVSATAVIDCLMDSMDENANASAASDNFDGLIDYMGDET